MNELARLHVGAGAAEAGDERAVGAGGVAHAVEVHGVRPLELGVQVLEVDADLVADLGAGSAAPGCRRCRRRRARGSAAGAASCACRRGRRPCGRRSAPWCTWCRSMASRPLGTTSQVTGTAAIQTSTVRAEPVAGKSSRSRPRAASSGRGRRRSVLVGVARMPALRGDGDGRRHVREVQQAVRPCTCRASVKVTFVVRPNGVSRELSMPGNDANPLPMHRRRVGERLPAAVRRRLRAVDDEAGELVRVGRLVGELVLGPAAAPGCRPSGRSRRCAPRSPSRCGT